MIFPNDSSQIKTPAKSSAVIVQKEDEKTCKVCKAVSCLLDILHPCASSHLHSCKCASLFTCVLQANTDAPAMSQAADALVGVAHDTLLESDEPRNDELLEKKKCGGGKLMKSNKSGSSKLMEQDKVGSGALREQDRSGKGEHQSLLCKCTAYAPCIW